MDPPGQGRLRRLRRHALLPGEAGAAAGVAPLAGVGRWAAVEELPDELAEGWFPLLPLVANPAVPDSDATGATIFFGLVPTGSADVDESGTARFDDAASYEIRCFVRRHKPACPRGRSGPQCHCPITWSDPTESYMLASHFDLQGTANRPVTVQLPDLNALQSDAMTLPPGSTGGCMKAPQSLMATATFPPSGSIGRVGSARSPSRLSRSWPRSSWSCSSRS